MRESCFSYHTTKCPTELEAIGISTDYKPKPHIANIYYVCTNLPQYKHSFN